MIDNRLTVFAFVNFSSHFLISSGETLLLDKSMYPAKTMYFYKLRLFDFYTWLPSLNKNPGLCKNLEPFTKIAEYEKVS